MKDYNVFVNYIIISRFKDQDIKRISHKIFHFLRTKVVNVKVKYIRPKFHTLKEWMNHPNHIYIARKGIVFINKKRFPSKSSIWANPFKINKKTTRKDVLMKYEKYIKVNISNNPEKYNLETLRGKVLGCWCHPAECHGDVLLKLLGEKV